MIHAAWMTMRDTTLGPIVTCSWYRNFVGWPTEAVADFLSYVPQLPDDPAARVFLMRAYTIIGCVGLAIEFMYAIRVVRSSRDSATRRGPARGVLALGVLAAIAVVILVCFTAGALVTSGFYLTVVVTFGFVFAPTIVVKFRKQHK